MIDLKNKDERSTNFVIIGSIAIIVLAGLFIKFAPAPKREYTDAQAKQDKNKVLVESATSKAKAATADQIIADQTWPGTEEEVLPLALQKVTTIALNHHLKVVGFHPQKPIETSSITMNPCVVNVSGPFPSVIGFERDLEAPGSKLAVNIMQFATEDQTSNKVSANIGIIAYQPAKTPAKDSDTTKPKAGVKKNA